MTTTVSYGQKRAFSELRTVKEEVTIDWTISNFTMWAETKERGFFQSSPKFDFYVRSLRKVFTFGLKVYPKGVKLSESTPDEHIGIFLVNNNTDCLFVKMKLQLLKKGGAPTKVYETDRKMDANTDWGWKSLILRSKLTTDNLLPDGNLMISCDISFMTSQPQDVSYDLSPSSKVSKTLEDDLKRMQSEAKFTDFQIVCKHRTFDVHKAVLAARSDVMDAMLAGDTIETKENRLHIRDFDPDEVANLITFMYTGKVDRDDVSHTLLLLADKYNVCDLVTECEDLLIKNITDANAVDLLDISSKVPAVSALLKTTSGYIARHFNRIKKTGDWKRLTEHNPSALKHVLDEF